ncbi:MAG: hypothetical protein ACON31_07300 [Candidatus Puniceispirillaceae bacterium]
MSQTPTSQMLFRAGDRLFRDNLHGHSTHSDGREDTAEVVFDIGTLDADFIRLVITDSTGRAAWSNIFWMVDLA